MTPLANAAAVDIIENENSKKNQRYILCMEKLDEKKKWLFIKSMYVIRIEKYKYDEKNEKKE